MSTPLPTPQVSVALVNIQPCCPANDISYHLGHKGHWPAATRLNSGQNLGPANKEETALAPILGSSPGLCGRR